MIVAKFGGTSVSSEKAISNICQILENEKSKDPAVVVSALSGVTDLLLSLPTLPKYKFEKEIRRLRSLHKNLIVSVLKDTKRQKDVLRYVNEKINEISSLNLSNPDKKLLDKLSSYGEIMSSYIVTNALEQRGIKATQVIATDLIVTNDNFGSAEFILEATQQKVKKVLDPLIKSGIVPVVTGFIGATKKGEVTTLGRGGSDYSASIIGFCLNAKEIQIWTDVDGIFSADPKLIKNARRIETVSFREASELATFGARVLHPKTIRPAIKMGIPVRVLNTFNPKNEGTLIVEKIKSNRIIRAISFKRKITLVNIYSAEMLLQKGFLAKVFSIFAKNNISIDLVSVSEVSVSVTLDNRDNLNNAVLELSKFSNVTVSENLGMVSLIGEGITDSHHHIKKFFDILDNQKILPKMISLGATNINISIVVRADQVEKAVKKLHHHLLNSDKIA